MHIINSIIRKKGFINICQWVMLFIFILLFLLLFIPGKELNIASIIIWGIWWPSLTIITLTLGRVWCAICPLKLVSNLSSKAITHIPDKGWSLLFSFLLVHLLMLQFPLVYKPFVTGIFLLSLLIASAYSVLSKHLFCETLCPLKFMLSCYQLCSPVSFGIIDSPTCEKCDLCIVSCEETSYKERFQHKTEDVDCTLCFSCTRKCPNKNIGYKWVGFFKKINKKRTFSMAKGFFLILLFCLMLNEWFGEIPGFEDLVSNSMLVKKMSFASPIINISGKIPLFILVLPFFFWMFPVSLYTLITGETKSFFNKYSVFFVPLVASMHFTKSIIKLNTLLPFMSKFENIKLYNEYKTLNTCALLSENLLLLCISIFIFCIGIFSVLRMDKECNREYSYKHTWLIGLFIIFLTIISSLVTLIAFVKKGGVPSFDIC